MSCTTSIISLLSSARALSSTRKSWCCPLTWEEKETENCYQFFFYFSSLFQAFRAGPQLTERLEIENTQYYLNIFHFRWVTLLQFSRIFLSSGIGASITLPHLDSCCNRMITRNFFPLNSMGWSKEVLITQERLCKYEKKIFYCFYKCFLKFPQSKTSQPCHTLRSLQTHLSTSDSPRSISHII